MKYKLISKFLILDCRKERQIVFAKLLLKDG